MKILCVNYEYPPVGGGGATASKGLAEALVRRGHEIDVVTSRMSGLAATEEVNGVRIHRVDCVRRHRHYVTSSELATHLIPAYRKILALARQRNYAVNHTHFIFPSGLASYLLWRRTGLPYVITAHGSDVPGYNPDRFKLPHILLQPLWRKIVGGASCVVAPSRFLKRLIETRADASIEVVPNGIEPLLATAPAPKQNRILIVTRIFERKGVQYFLRALEGLDTDWDICIAGDGPYLPQLREMATLLRRPVRFLGFVARSDLAELYQSAKIFVFPSIQENYPIVLLEAMSAGCAVITTTAEGCAEVVGDAAIKVRPESVEELRDTLARLLRDGSEIERLASLSRERAACHAWSELSGAYEEILTRHAR